MWPVYRLSCISICSVAYFFYQLLLFSNRRKRNQITYNTCTVDVVVVLSFLNYYFFFSFLFHSAFPSPIIGLSIFSFLLPFFKHFSHFIQNSIEVHSHRNNQKSICNTLKTKYFDRSTKKQKSKNVRRHCTMHNAHWCDRCNYL